MAILSSDEQIEMICKMNEKLTKIESMDMSQHMSVMDDMMKKDSGYHDDNMMKKYSTPVYNEVLNPIGILFPTRASDKMYHNHD